MKSTFALSYIQRLPLIMARQLSLNGKAHTLTFNVLVMTIDALEHF